MPLLVVFVGVALLISALRNTQGDLYSLVAGDLPGFLKWAGAIIAIGLLGYIPRMETPSRILLGIVIFVVIASNQGAFANLAAIFKNPPQASLAPNPLATPLGPLPVQLNLGLGSGGASGGGVLGAIGSAVKLGGAAAALVP